MLKKFLSISLITIVFVSCMNPAANKPSKNYQEEEKPTNKDPNFPIEAFGRVMFVKKDSISKGADFIVDFNMLNNTNTRITKFKISALLLVKYKGEKMIAFPGANEYEYIKNRWITDLGYDNLQNEEEVNVDLNNPWKPLETKGFRFKIYWRKEEGLFLGLRDNLFTRTPDEVILNIKYEGLGVEGEYNNSINFDILDRWEDHQRELGFR